MTELMTNIYSSLLVGWHLNVVFPLNQTKLFVIHHIFYPFICSADVTARISIPLSEFYLCTLKPRCLAEWRLSNQTFRCSVSAEISKSMDNYSGETGHAKGNIFIETPFTGQRIRCHGNSSQRRWTHSRRVHFQNTPCPFKWVDASFFFFFLLYISKVVIRVVIYKKAIEIFLWKVCFAVQ